MLPHGRVKAKRGRMCGVPREATRSVGILLTEVDGTGDTGTSFQEIRDIHLKMVSPIGGAAQPATAR